MSTKKKVSGRLSPRELSVFCAQMSMLIKSGNAPYESVNILLGDTRDQEGKAILTSMMEVLSRGEKLHTAMEAAGVFPDYVIHMITIGEEAGEPDTVLDALSAFYEREDSLKETVRSALSYPLIMIGIMFVVILVLVTQVLPIFAQVFAQLGTGMNAFSVSLLQLGTRMNRYSFVIVAILAVLVVAGIWLMRSESGKRVLSRIGQAFPPTRRLGAEIAAGRFASGMALTLSSGMDTYQSMELMKKIVENRDIGEKIEQAEHLILEKGCTFPEAMEQTAVFTQLYTRMIHAGFKSGSMVRTMRQIADHYEKEADRKIYGIISVVEPTLIILLSLIVGLILLSVILPLMGIMSGIG
ncbi:MAG: type II secretion system F family protein [Lachnospiraceae bacterium]|nr:type II secretion system F family protein [Lachnospiraceae bacterium]